jgi:hypothetical protein
LKRIYAKRIFISADPGMVIVYILQSDDVPGMFDAVMEI